MRILVFVAAIAVTPQEPADRWPENRIPPQARSSNAPDLVASWSRQYFEGGAWKPDHFVGNRPAPHRTAVEIRRVDSWRVIDGSMTVDVATFAAMRLREAREADPAIVLREVESNAAGGVEGAVALAIGSVAVPESGVWMARLAGASLLWVNGEPFQGDHERREFDGVPVELGAGANEIVVLGIEGGFALEFWAPDTEYVVANWDLWYPRDGRGRFEARTTDALMVPIFNATTATLTSRHVHYGRGAFDDEPSRAPHEWMCRGTAEPLSLTWAFPYLFDIASEEADLADKEVAWFSLAVFVEGESNADRRAYPLKLRQASTAERPREPLAWFEFSALLEPTPRRARDAGPIVATIVYGTAGGRGAARALLASARHLQQRLWYECDVLVDLIPDEAILESITANRFDTTSPMLLLGDRRSNRAWARLPMDVDDAAPQDERLWIVPDARTRSRSLRVRVGFARVSDEAARRALAVFPLSIAEPFSAKRVTCELGPLGLSVAR